MGRKLSERKAKIRDLFTDMLRAVPSGGMVVKSQMQQQAGLSMPEDLGVFVSMFQRARDTVRNEGIIFRSRVDIGEGALYRFTPEEAAQVLAQGRRMHAGARRKHKRGRQNAVIASEMAQDPNVRDTALRSVEHADRLLAVTRMKRELPVYAKPPASSDAGADPHGKRRRTEQAASVQ